MFDMINIFEVFLPQLLRYPNPTDPLNGEAAALLMRDPKSYEAKVKGQSVRFTRGEEKYIYIYKKKIYKKKELFEIRAKGKPTQADENWVIKQNMYPSTPTKTPRTKQAKKTNRKTR